MQITRQGPLPNDPSIISANRTRKTHKDAETISRISKLPIESRLRINFNKQTRNASRRERVFEGNDDVSDVSSYLSIPEEEYDKMLKDQDYFDKVKAWLSAHTISWLVDKRKSLRLRTREGDDTSVEASSTQPTKRFRANDDLNEIDPTSPPNVFFDQAFLDLGLYGYHIPLALFTNKNIEFLNNNSISFHRTKISHIEGKPQILDLADVIKKVKGSREGGPTQDLAMEHFEWLEATANFFVYQSLLYAEGDEANEPQFYRKHFGFFENQTDSVKLFDLWKDIELELRQKHQSKKTHFDLFDYRTEWSRVKSRLDSLDTSSSSNSSQPQSNRRSHIPNFRSTKIAAHDTPPTTSSNSFPLGNKEKASREPCCIICGGVGHTFFAHSDSTHGPAKWALRDGKELLHPSSKVRLCTYWNIFSTCSKKCPSASHICTFCGGSHPALRWDSSCTVSRPAGY
ncbi:uncharacterized protein C8R40DRAFT_1185322 [Lentinula edodes]|uniref:uncharacterized protein n=1 Tax=Lentinula edodes TaxID=5353 RepID=UPI001E8CE335|nr:uncharacterized protein C8R40DRAFT_1185322 [Lentinula edodes]KAH7876395.1 hypothetical protein C8R40DRAFT_1185322 [Lentinula edodes]